MKVAERALAGLGLFGAIHVSYVRCWLLYIIFFSFRFLSVRLVSNVPHPEKYVFCIYPFLCSCSEVYICEI